MMANDDVRICSLPPTSSPTCTGTQPAMRPSTCGRARPRSSPSTAAIKAGAGDYVIVPRGTIHRWLPAPAACTRWSSRRAATSGRPGDISRSSASSWSTRRTASVICADRMDRC